jgi:hypothetical protein
MELLLQGANLQRGAKEAVQAVLYICKKEACFKQDHSNSNYNSSLLPISPFYLAPRIGHANFGCNLAPGGDRGDSGEGAGRRKSYSLNTDNTSS